MKNIKLKCVVEKRIYKKIFYNLESIDCNISDKLRKIQNRKFQFNRINP